MTTAENPRFVMRVITASHMPMRRFHLSTGEYLVGSAATADVLLPVSGVSRMHARIEVPPEGPLVITDLASRNGTWVDGARVERAEIAHAVSVAFGPVLVALAAIDELTASVSVLRPGAPPSADDRGGGAGAGDQVELTTAERLAEGTSLVVGLLARGSVTPAEGILRLAQEWRKALGGLLIEVAHQPAHGPRVTITVSDPSAPAVGPGLEVEGEGGWRIIVSGDGSVDLAALRPMARVALAALAAVAGHGPAGLRTSQSLRLQDTVQRAEREALLAALARAGGDASRAAALLGVSRTTCQRKLKDLGLLFEASPAPPKS